MSRNIRLEGGENYSLSTLFPEIMTKLLFLTSSEIIVGEMKMSTLSVRL